LSEKTWVRVDFLAIKVKVVGMRVWRTEVAFMRAVRARVFIIAFVMEFNVVNEVCVYNKNRVEWSKKCTRSSLSQEEASRQTTLEGGTVPHFVTSSPKQDQSSLQQIEKLSWYVLSLIDQNM
jgi:hypothetical protein